MTNAKRISIKNGNTINRNTYILYFDTPKPLHEIKVEYIKIRSKNIYQTLLYVSIVRGFDTIRTVAQDPPVNSKDCEEKWKRYTKKEILQKHYFLTRYENNRSTKILWNVKKIHPKGNTPKTLLSNKIWK